MSVKIKRDDRTRARRFSDKDPRIMTQKVRIDFSFLHSSPNSQAKDAAREKKIEKRGAEKRKFKAR